MNERILIVEDEETLCESLKRVLSREGYVVETVSSAESAIQVFDERFYDLIITDIILPGITGIELLKKIKEKLPGQTVVIMTAYASLETAVEALRSGAYDYIVKPVMHEEVKQVVRNALTQGALLEENVRLKKLMEKEYDPDRIIGEGPEIERILGEVKGAAKSGGTVLLLGEIGTGKELLARMIHGNSSRADKPFISIDRNVLLEEYINVISRLFGHVKGAFPDATTSRKGLFEEANGGTVFFREALDIDAGLQSKLVRVLEDREITPVGGKEAFKIDIQFIFATNGDIESAVSERKFRADLLGKIGAVSIKIPPLRERRDDIRPFVCHFIERYSCELGKTVRDIDGEALEVLQRYPWPGNVRELRNVIERAILTTEGRVIKAGDLLLFSR
ncbi:MAG TPA: sigma-54 dependent transcriptional regulator [Thermodesulfovibrionales bacterium]|nr:sigma-54 dependent transcriptional regulator [Thermodesulfovibrionales bacterium]